MTYQQCLDWLFNQLPMYQRTGGGSNYKIDLSKTHQLMELLGQPQKGFKSIHVAGTNGKGSVSHMLAAIFQKAGYKTGLYTSPHLKDFRERIRINGEMIPEADVIEFVEKYQKDFSRLELSFFEMTVGMAFDHFRKEEVDIAIVEVGMGGRLDSTNVITPELSVITNISLDHTQFLGDTIAKIAGEKAGIVKPKIPVLIGERQIETTGVFEEVAERNNAPLYFAEDLIWDREIYELDLPGFYQNRNLKTVLAAVEVLAAKYPLRPCLKEALQNTRKLTGLRGRWEVLGENPKIICDTGHNEAGVKIVVDQLRQQSFDGLHIVWGMVGDKDAKAVLNLLPKEARYYWCKPAIPRGKGASELAEEAEQTGLMGRICESVEDALAAAKREANPEDLIFVGGSTFVVAEVI